jgi:hypothetical protein
MADREIAWQARPRVHRRLPSATQRCQLAVVAAYRSGSPLNARGQHVPDLFIAGNDVDAKQRVRTLLGDFGWSVIDIGDIQNLMTRRPTRAQSAPSGGAGAADVVCARATACRASSNVRVQG